MAQDCCSSKAEELEALGSRRSQRRTLLIVLWINAVMFVAEFGAGAATGSTALMADATDMLGDALVYGISLFALSRSAQWKAGAALFKGIFILLFGVVILVNVIVKLTSGVPPSSAIMLAFGAIALLANLVCLGLLMRFRNQDVNMRSTFECSRNDVISNCGVLIAAGAVALTKSAWPDVLIGGVIALLFLRSALRVIRSASAELFAHG